MIGHMDDMDPRVVTVIGAGVAGTQSILKAIDNKALVKVVDSSQSKLDDLKSKYGTENVEYILSSKDSIQVSVNESDLVIGSVYVVGKEAPKVVTKDMLSSMNPGTVMVDVSIDQGGCFETSKPTTHQDPTFLIDDILHYCVSNMPGAVPLTASESLNSASLSYVQKLANNDLNLLLNEQDFKSGLNIMAGEFRHPSLIDII